MTTATATATPPRTRSLIARPHEVRAMLAGRQTMFRRPIRHPGDFLGGGGKSNREEWDDPRCWGWEDPENPSHFIVLAREPEPGDVPVRCPFGRPGDRLWLKETWAPRADVDPAQEPEKARHYCLYRADGSDHPRFGAHWHDFGDRWRPASTMPRWASRLTLEIAEVRVERLAEISEADAIAEGCSSNWKASENMETARQHFARLWDAHYGKRPGCSWADNPWLWCVRAKRAED
jgi:hypothetical protein